MLVSENPQSQWCISGEVSASRALALAACLRVLTHFEGEYLVYSRLSHLTFDSDLADCVNTVIVFYATSLSHVVGKAYIPPSLSFLARWWFDVSSTSLLMMFLPLPSAHLCRLIGELRLAARTLFDAGVASLTDEETICLVERWQHSCNVFVLRRPISELISTRYTVPFLLPDSERRSPVAAKALLLCGFIATRQYKLLSTRCVRRLWGMF